MNLRYERKKPQNDTSIAAKIIWSPKEMQTYYEVPQNSYCLFRKRFQIDDHVKKADIKIFADSRYILYVNGKRIGRGPCRSDPRWQYYDTYDIAEHLVKGENVLSAEVLYYGYGTGHSICRVPALVAQSSILLNSGESITIVSDRSWETCLSDALDRNAPRVNGCKACVEIWDKRKEFDFDPLRCDDLPWEAPRERELALSPFWNLYPKPIANLEEDYTLCRSIVACGIGKSECVHPSSNLHQQLKTELDNLPSPVFSLVTQNVFAPAEEGTFRYCVLDFQQVLAGYISIELMGNSGDIVDVVFSESLFRGKPVINYASYRPVARFILKDGINTIETKFNYEAFRYAFLIFRNDKQPIVLKRAGIVTRRYPLDTVSVFRTENELLQKIWDISTHTLKLCMQDGFLDSPSREQQQWMGDGRFQAIMNYYYSGDCRMHEKLLLQIAQSQDIEGMTCSRYPDANHNYPPIPSFCLQWICSFGDYYRFTDKTELISDLWNDIIAAMRWFSGFENTIGILEGIKYWQYYDISRKDDGEAIKYSTEFPNAFINLMYAEAMKTVIDLARVLEDNETEDFFRAKFNRIKNSIKEVFWDDDIGAYSLYREKRTVMEAVNALAITVLHRPVDDEAQRIVTNVFDRKTCVPDVYRVSPYFMVPLYRAMNKMDRNDIALSETLHRYALMIESDATSTWEEWRLIEGDFMYSACHAWAAAPILFVAENLLGINGDPSGQNKIEIGAYDARIVTPKGVYEMHSSEIRDK